MSDSSFFNHKFTHFIYGYERKNGCAGMMFRSSYIYFHFRGNQVYFNFQGVKNKGFLLFVCRT